MVNLDDMTTIISQHFSRETEENYENLNQVTWSPKTRLHEYGAECLQYDRELSLS